MAVHEHSKQAYHDLKTDKGKKIGKMQQKVINALKFKPMTRQALAKHLNWKINSVCGRCRELLDAGVIEQVDAIQVKVGGKTTSRGVLGLTEGGQLLLLPESAELGQ